MERWDFDRFQVCGEAKQEWGFVGEMDTRDAVAIFPDLQNYVEYVIDVALGIDWIGTDRGSYGQVIWATPVTWGVLCFICDGSML